MGFRVLGFRVWGLKFRAEFIPTPAGRSDARQRFSQRPGCYALGFAALGLGIRGLVGSEFMDEPNRATSRDATLDPAPLTSTNLPKSDLRKELIVQCSGKLNR